MSVSFGHACAGWLDTLLSVSIYKARTVQRICTASTKIDLYLLEALYVAAEVR